MAINIEKKKVDYTQGSIIQSIIKMGTPSMIGFLAGHIYHLVDMYWVARLPEKEAAVAAVKAGFDKEPVFIREGGTLPILPLFKEVLGAESLMMGFCRPDCNAHGPNEFFAVSDLQNGAKSSAHFLYSLAQIP